MYNVCRRDFPDDCTSQMTIHTPESGLSKTVVCAICALEKRNELSGMTLKDFSPGSMAQAMLVRCRKYLEKT